MSEIQTLETELKTEAEKIGTDIKLDFNKVMAILRALLPGDHEAIGEVKKLAAAGEPVTTTPSGSATETTIPAPVAADSAASSTSADTVS